MGRGPRQVGRSAVVEIGTEVAAVVGMSAMAEVGIVGRAGIGTAGVAVVVGTLVVVFAAVFAAWKAGVGPRTGC